MTKEPRIILWHNIIQAKYKRGSKVIYPRISQFSQVKSSSLVEGRATGLFKRFRLERLVKEAGISKVKGHEPMDMLLLMLLMILERSRSVYSGIISLQKRKLKNPLNNLLNNPNYNWRKLLYSVARRFAVLCPPPEGAVPVLIIDDTAKVKTGRKGEHTAWFVDHCKKVYYIGFQVIVSVWSNGIKSIPLDLEFKIGNSKVKHAAKGHYHKGTHTRTREGMGKQKKLDIAVSFIKRALQRRFVFDYVLWDSWYNSSRSLRFVFDTLVGRGINLIAMQKRDKQKYLYNGQYLAVKQLYKKAGKFSIQNETGIKFKSLVATVLDKRGGSDFAEQKHLGQVRMCFFKYPGIKGFKVIISTDRELSELEILELYLRRWAVEVVFRDLKQHFGFDQSKSSKYAPQIADLTIRCVFYILFCSLGYQHPEKSTEQLLIEFHLEMQENWLDILCKIVFHHEAKSFLRYALRQGYKDVGSLLVDLDTVIFKFFDNDWGDDKLEELDNHEFTRFKYRFAS